MIELSDDAIETLAAKRYERATKLPWIALEADSRRLVWLSEARRDLQDIYPLIAARVHAEAVAGEPEIVAWAVRAADGMVYVPGDSPIQAGTKKQAERVAARNQGKGGVWSVVPLVAGSVPVAASEPMRFKDTLPIEVNEAYVRLSDAPVARTCEHVKDAVLVDYDRDGYPVGVEIHFAGPVPAGQPPTFEQLLTDPLEQFDTRSELLPAILRYLTKPGPADHAREALLRSIEEYRNAPPATASTSNMSRPAEQPEER